MKPDPFIQRHLDRIRITKSALGYPDSKLFAQCFPDTEGAINVPNSNLWIKEIDMSNLSIVSSLQPVVGVEEIKKDISKILCDNIKYDRRSDAILIHGAIQKIIEYFGATSNAPDESFIDELKTMCPNNGPDWQMAWRFCCDKAKELLQSNKKKEEGK